MNKNFDENIYTQTFDDLPFLEEMIQVVKNAGIGDKRIPKGELGIAHVNYHMKQRGFKYGIDGKKLSKDKRLPRENTRLPWFKKFFHRK